MRKILQNDSKEYWTYKDYHNNGLNSICRYPAMMIDEMQKEILVALTKEGKIEKLFDPFHGAGTTLITAQEMEIQSFGIDINPFATLITEVKLYNYTFKELKSALNRIIKSTETMKASSFLPFAFEKIDKWFREDIIAELTVIRNSITKLRSARIRKFFWICFAEIIRKYSNTRSSTFKLHIKTYNDIENIKQNVVKDFIEKAKENIEKITLKNNRQASFTLWSGNSVDLIQQIDDSFFDAIFTSPPYGDNSTTVTYGQFSTLQLRWIDQKDLPINSNEINKNFSSIDALSLGGRRLKANSTLSSVNDYVKKIHKSKRAKVIDFMFEYELVFSQMIRVLKPSGFMTITLGNRRVDNKLVPFNKVHEELAEKYGLTIMQTLTRGIEKKRMAQRVSKDRKGNSIKSMSEEYIMIFKKER